MMLKVILVIQAWIVTHGDNMTHTDI